MKALRAYGRFALVSSAFAVAACNQPAAGSTSGDASARTGDVQSAVSKPTGTVDASSAATVISQSQASADLQGFDGYLAALPGLSALSAVIDLSGSTSGGVSGGLPGGILGAACVGGGSTAGSIDLSCASSGAASGTISFETDAAAGQGDASTYLTITYAGACQKGICVDGTVAVKSAGSSGSGSGSGSVVLDADLDVTGNGAPGHAHFGLQGSGGAQASLPDLAVFDAAGDSFVLDAAASQGSGSLTITGANGSFTCQYSSGGKTGSCSGSGSFSW